METDIICEICRHPAVDYARNMTYDRYGQRIRCPTCVEVTRGIEWQRREWSRRVVNLVQKLGPELQESYQWDLRHGTLREFLVNMRESGRSPGEAVRAWRHKTEYIDATLAANQRPIPRARPSSSQFQVKLDTVPQRQYQQPSELPVITSPPMKYPVLRPTLPVIFSKPTQIIPSSTNDSVQQTYYPIESDSGSESFSDTDSDSSEVSFHGRASGIVKDRKGRVSVVVTDDWGRRMKAHSALAYFVT